MKASLPAPLVWAAIVLVLVVLAVVAYMSFMKPVQQVDVKTLSPQRLEDPDMRGGG